ncbi:hypothetical protein [Actibacterium sp. 188UL27-1]|uniref:hypothetical protein n=1 Tax=Actibacterium sp. 188UL27-1 TaxID=2786961 RepID=UPI0019582086|nr:hypothetical protein [Actibacterium sp. 188UL27-1]MBM7069611.1 hypothetical protein [Actibacterium sp. 188UL27-1]
MIEISDTQFAGQKRHKRATLIERIDDWLLVQDSAWSLLEPPRRIDMLEQIVDKANLYGMRSARDHAIFCRGTILLRLAWPDFMDEPQNQVLLTDDKVDADSKLRAWFNRCWQAAQTRAGQKA